MSRKSRAPAALDARQQRVDAVWRRIFASRLARAQDRREATDLTDRRRINS